MRNDRSVEQSAQLSRRVCDSPAAAMTLADAAWLPREQHRFAPSESEPE
jgi:hypothetical protein